MCKLPKQWPDWIYHAGLRPEGRRPRRGLYNRYCYLKGHGRRWRVNMFGTLDMSETYATFDRWANSTEATVAIPLTRDEFVALIRNMS